MSRSHEPTQLSGFLIGARQDAGLSRRALAHRAGIGAATLDGIELGSTTHPTPPVLAALADALSVPLADLFGLVGYVNSKALPELNVYMRAKHPDLPTEAVNELGTYFEFLKDKYDVDEAGPPPGADETA